MRCEKYIYNHQLDYQFRRIFIGIEYSVLAHLRNGLAQGPILDDVSPFILARFTFLSYGHTICHLEHTRTLEEPHITGTIHLVLYVACQLFSFIGMVRRTLMLNPAPEPN